MQTTKKTEKGNGPKVRLRILCFIMDFIIKNSYSPTVREICNGVGINSTSWVKYHMGIMREQGVISFVDKKSRTITVIKRPIMAGGANILTVAEVDSGCGNGN